MPDWVINYAQVFGLAFVIALVGTPLIRFLAIKCGAVDLPSERKIHTKPIPRLGGVAIYLGFMLSLILTESLTSQQKGMIIGASLSLVIGIVDDVKSLPAWFKLLALFGITWYLANKGVVLNFLPGGYGLNVMLTLFWIVGVTSAVNAIDHRDGLASGLTLIACLSYAFIAIQNFQWQWAALSVALMGSCLGFLVFNYPPAKIFMGDAGSFFLGYSLAVLSVMGEWSTNEWKAIAIPNFILGLLIFDLIYVVIRRFIKKEVKGLRQMVSYSAKDHFSHRLVKVGFSSNQALWFSYFTALAFAMGAAAMRQVSKVEAIILCVQLFVIALLINALIEIGIGCKKSKKYSDYDH